MSLATPTLAGDPSGRSRPGVTDTPVARLEGELRRLRGRRRAWEEALERVSNALLTLRRANRALAEENSILRLELQRLEQDPPNVSGTHGWSSAEPDDEHLPS